jgi:hypothetical protein
LEELKVEAADKKLGRHKSYWLRHVTRMNGSRMPNIKLNYIQNGRRQLGKTFDDTNRRDRNRTIKAELLTNDNHHH